MIQKRISKTTGAVSYTVRLPRPQPNPSGKKFVCKTFPTKKEAQDWEAEQRHKLNTGAFVEPSQVPLGDYLREWLAGVAGQVRPRTLEGYRRLLTRYVYPHPIAAIPLAHITPQDLRRLYNTELLGRGLSPRSVQMVHGVLRPAFKQAVTDQRIARYPLTGVKPPRLEHREMQALDHDQVERLLAASEATGSRWHALWVLLVHTGLRPSEALGLQWTDVRGGLVHVRHTLVVTTEGWRLMEPKTKRSRRRAELLPEVQQALAWHHARQEAEKVTAGCRYLDRGLVFASQTGGPLDLKNVVARHFKPLLRAYYPLPDIRLYDLRHTFASNALAAGVDVLDVSERLGHTSAKLTYDVYGHVLSANRAAGTARLVAYYTRGGASTEGGGGVTVEPSVGQLSEQRAKEVTEFARIAVPLQGASK